MAKAKIALGGELDIVTKGELDDALGTLRHGFGDDLKMHSSSSLPTRRVLVNAGVLANVVPKVVLDFGHPQHGLVWDLRLYVLTGGEPSGPQPGFTSAITPVLYTGDPSNPSMFGVKDPPISSATPIYRNYSARSVIVDSSENLLVAVYQGTNGDTVTGILSVLEYDVESVLRMRI